MRRPCPRGTAALARQRGQALAFALIFLAVGAVALFVAFNASQLTSARSKLQNTADATAYSVAVLQARDYNFSAYANRAMVANQVAVAQLLSLKSWIEEVDEVSRKDHVTDTLVDIFADLGQLQWTTPKNISRPILAPIKSLVNQAVPPAVKGLDLLNFSLSTAQETYRVATITNYPFVASAIAKANQPDTSADAGYMATLGAPKILAWQNYVKRIVPKNEVKSTGGRDRFADVATDPGSHDNFTLDRGAARLPFVAGTAYKGCKGAAATFMDVGEPHSGATQLRADAQGWEALDATAASPGSGIYCVWFVPEPIPLFIPIIESYGRGGAANGPGNRYSGTSGYRGRGHIGDAIASMAAVAAAMQYSAGPGSSVDNSSRAGLQPYRDLAKPENAVPGKQDFNRAPAITVQVTRKTETARTTSAMQVGVGRVALKDGSPSNEMRALASASAYFIRPRDNGGAGSLLNRAAWRRNDGKFEYPSLFNPYWQASLVDTSTLDLEAAGAAQAAGVP